MKTLLTITLIVELLFGVGFIVMPATLLNTFGVTLSDVGVTLARFLGSALLGFVVLLWYGRSAEEGGTQRAVMATMFTYFSISTIFAVLAQIQGVMNAMGWTTVGLHLVLAVAFGWFLFRR